MFALKDQKQIDDQLKGNYFFCSQTGKMFEVSNVRIRVWIPALERAGLEYREMKQTRHSFLQLIIYLGARIHSKLQR